VIGRFQRGSSNCLEIEAGGKIEVIQFCLHKPAGVGGVIAGLGLASIPLAEKNNDDKVVLNLSVIIIIDGIDGGDEPACSRSHSGLFDQLSNNSSVDGLAEFDFPCWETPPTCIWLISTANSKSLSFRTTTAIAPTTGLFIASDISN
jgi:hypothetical protein